MPPKPLRKFFASWAKHLSKRYKLPIRAKLAQNLTTHNFLGVKKNARRAKLADFKPRASLGALAEHDSKTIEQAFGYQNPTKEETVL